MHAIEHRAVTMLPRTSTRDLQIAKAVELALWLAFTGNLARGLLHGNDLLRHLIGRPMVDAAGCVLIFQGLTTIRDWRRSCADRLTYQLTCLVLAIALFAMLHGLMSNPDIERWFQMGVMAFGTGVAVFLGCRPFVFERVFRCLRWQLYIGQVFVLFVLLHWMPRMREEWWRTAQNTEALGPIASRCLFALPFVIANHRKLRPWELALVGIAYVEFLVLNIVGINRAAIVIALVVIPILLIATSLRLKQSLRRMRRIAFCAIVAVIMFGQLSQYFLSANVSLRADFEDLMARFNVDDMSAAEPSDILSGVETTIQDDFAGGGKRSQELHDLLSQTSLPQFLFGRGFGVSWHCPTYAEFSSEWYVVHIGPGYMLLVGGLPLAICFSALFAVALWKSWKCLGKNPAAEGALFFLAAAAVNYFQHGFLMDEPEFYFFWLSIGFSVTAIRKTRVLSTQLLRPIRLRAPIGSVACAPR